MPAASTAAVKPPTNDQRRISLENFERAKQVIATGNYDYGIQLLLLCCQIEPGSLQFRNALRRAQKDKYGQNLRGSRLAFLTTSKQKAKVKAAKASRDYLKVLEHGELVLCRNPWDTGTQMDMAEAFDALGLLDLAVFSLNEARQKAPKDATVNRALARLLEKRGDFNKAIVLWQLVKEAAPTDVEAAHKAKDLAASETIARGGYAESVAGSKESPVLAKMEAAAVEKQDKAGKEAAGVLKRIEASPTEPSLYLQLAGIYRRHGQDDRARAALQQGLGPTGQHHSLQMELLELDLAPVRKNIDLTDARLKKLAANPDADDDGPSVEELTKTKAKLYKELLTREADLFRLRADRSPNDLIHRLDLGVRLMKLGQLDEAIAELQQVRRDEKLKGRAAMHLGQCFLKRNNWRLAERNFTEAMEALPATEEKDRKEVLFQLASGNATAGDLARALDLGHELANLDYSYKNIGKLLDEWQAKADG